MVLGVPSSVGRKGEYKKELLDVQKAGYVRVRVDGEMYEVTDDIPMDRYKQHTIEVVVDRIVVKEGIERRLTDSIEAALKMGRLVTLSYETSKDMEVPPDVAAIAAREAGEPSPEHVHKGDALFSESYACAVCGYSLPELEPRMFSFNSPYGACPECTGLGTKTEFDPELIAPDPRKPLRQGAILPFVYKSGEVKDWWPEMLDAVGRSCGFDASKPLGEIPEEGLRAVWHGLGGSIKVIMKTSRGGERSFYSHWNGVLASLRKRYEETESEWVKNDLEQYMSTKPCPVCEGRRLKPESLSVRLAGKDVSEVAGMSVEDSFRFFDGLAKKLNKRQLAIGERAVKEIVERLRFLQDVGLGYLTLDRNARTLAGGEAQRIRLATQIGSGLMGCLYILDEPSIGLHQRDNRKLIETLVRLRDLGNTVLVVEHDEETMLSADHLMELGPGAGEHGGKVVAEGSVKQFLASGCLTAQYLTGERRIEIPKQRRQPKTATVDAADESAGTEAPTRKNGKKQRAKTGSA